MKRNKIILQELHELAEQNKPEKVKFPADVVDYMQGITAGSEYESFFVICVDARRNIISIKKHAEGDIANVVVYTRKIFKHILNENAKAIILVHNHPVGEVDPSAADIRTTKQFKTVCDALQIQLLDHIIISDGAKHFSFVENDII